MDANGWQDIATAPREDGFVLVCFFRDGVYQPEIASRERQDESPGWYDPVGNKIFEPTHWQPLPGAPEVGA